jgi:hypothetical protein
VGDWRKKLEASGEIHHMATRTVTRQIGGSGLEPSIDIFPMADASDDD